MKIYQNLSNTQKFETWELACSYWDLPHRHYSRDSICPGTQPRIQQGSSAMGALGCTGLCKLCLLYFQLFIQVKYLVIKLLFLITTLTILIKLWVSFNTCGSNVVLSLASLILICTETWWREFPCAWKLLLHQNKNYWKCKHSSECFCPLLLRQVWEDLLRPSGLILVLIKQQRVFFFFLSFLASSVQVTHPLMSFSHSFLSLPEWVSIEQYTNGEGKKKRA